MQIEVIHDDERSLVRKFWKFILVGNVIKLHEYWIGVRPHDRATFNKQKHYNKAGVVKLWRDTEVIKDPELVPLPPSVCNEVKLRVANDLEIRR